jgi:hypothetical protein
MAGDSTMAEDEELKDVQATFNKDVQSMFNDEWVMAWMEEHKMDLRKSVSGQSILYWSLGIGFVVGLAAHVGGYLLLMSQPGGFLGLLADLLHALGWSLWTGVVVAMFIQVIPETKRRQIKQTLDAFEALQREKSQTGGNRHGVVSEKPQVGRAKRVQGQKQSRNRTRKGG